MIYFTADLHLGHKNIIKHCNRPFKHVKEMDDVLINNINEIVNADDQLIIIGDLICGASRGKIIQYLKRLNGKKTLILGNHDKRIDGDVLYYLEEVTYYKEITFNNYVFCLFHYPIEHWHWRNKESIHLCGHSHGNSTPTKNRIDVGVDCWDYKPVSIYQILERIEK